MALKDWKRLSSPSNTWNKSGTMQKLRVYNLSIGEVNPWTVYITRGNITRNFRTKTSAMKFAKSYMKTH